MTDGQHGIGVSEGKRDDNQHDPGVQHGGRYDAQSLMNGLLECGGCLWLYAGRLGESTYMLGKPVWWHGKRTARVEHYQGRVWCC